MRWLRGVAPKLSFWLPVAVALSGCDKPPAASEKPPVGEVAAKSGAPAEVEAEVAADDDASANDEGGDGGSEFLAAAAEAAPEAGEEVEAEEALPAEDVVVLDPGAPTIERPEALAGFFAALANTRRDGVARILHMGDSSIGMDGLPHAIRRRMQERFGDAGPGFVLIDRFSKNYTSNVAKIEAAGWKICYIAYLCKKDGRYGLGGHTFRGEGGAWTKLGPHQRNPFGREVSKIELWYAARPGGGDLKLRVDKGPYEVIPTRAEELDDRWHTVEVDPGEHTVELRPGGNGAVRVYGVVMENEGPGIVWDTVSMTGAYVRRLHGYDDQHIAGQVAHRDPDLLVINYGGNDLRRFVNRSVDLDDYKEEYRTTVRKLRQGKRDVACLIVGVTDHGRSGPYDVAPAHVEKMQALEREIAAEEGCAFFDSVAAMGGAGSVHDWLKQRKVSPDLKHLSRKGTDAMGEMIYNALLAAYSEHARGA